MAVQPFYAEHPSSMSICSQVDSRVRAVLQLIAFQTQGGISV
ncbi:hypothetical protein NPIL_468861, partial [Nephila pilipes]